MAYDNSQFKSVYFVLMSYFYLGQGYSLGSLVLLLPLYIPDQFNVAYTKAVVVSTIIIIPWYVKFIFGVLSDNYPVGGFGRRKPYLVIATIFSFIGWMSLDTHTTISIYFYISGLSLALGSALADSVIDGQIVEITPTHLASRTQGIAWGSRGFGLGLAAIISPLLADTYSWHAMFQVSAIFGISISILTLLLPQVPVMANIKGNRIEKMIKDIKKYIKSQNQYSFKSRIGFMLFSGSSIGLIPMLPLIMAREFQFNYTTIAIGSFLFAIGSLLGAFITGFLVEQHDTKNSFEIIVISLSLLILSGWLMRDEDTATIQFGFLFLLGFISSGFESYQLKIVQESSISGYEGSMFSFYTSVSNIGQFLLGSWIYVSIAEKFSISLFVPLIILLIPLYLARKLLLSFKFPKL